MNERTAIIVLLTILTACAAVLWRELRQGPGPNAVVVPSRIRDHDRARASVEREWQRINGGGR